MIVFVDDLNIPTRDEFGTQSPLEFIRQWMEYGLWFNLEKIVVKRVEKMQLISAMGPPGGARSKISPRLQSKFNVQFLQILTKIGFRISLCDLNLKYLISTNIRT